jgi:gliding motility-associated-like protein
MKIFLKSIFLFFIFQVVAQNQNNQWRFGYNSGINFNTTPPTGVANSQIFATEGTASIADRVTGALLFYTDGITVWNANNTVMSNGSGLFGGVPGILSSSCAAVIIPKPFSPNIYYIVTKDEQLGGKGLCYTKVDMTLNGGLGDVVATEKNIFLYQTESETLHVVPTNDLNGYWILTYNSPDAILGSTFVAIKLDQCGFSNTPVFSNFSNIETDTAYMKVNKQFNKLALTVPDGIDSKIRLFDFNNSTGILSNFIEWDYNGSLIYFSGVEFSPDGSKLYACGGITIKQYDITSNNSATIQNTEFQLPFLSGFSVISNLQLGPDNKIYVPTNILSVIQSPNLSGAACNYTSNAITGQQGQPISTFPQLINFINPNPPIVPSNAIIASGFCLGNVTQFSLQNNTGVTGVTWNFGEPTSGVQNTATGLSSQHTFLTGNNFTVTATVFYGCTSQTVTANVSIKAPQSISVAPITLCQNSGSPALPATIPATSVIGTWSPSNINTAIIGTSNYTFTANPGQCVAPNSFTLAVTITNPVTPIFNAISPICAGENTNPLQTVSVNNISGSWSPAFNNTATTTYTFTPNVNQCSTNATITIIVNENVIPTFSLNSILCSGGAIPSLPNLSNNNISGIWSPTSIDNLISATYTFTPNSNQCAVPFSLTTSIIIADDFNITQGCINNNYTLNAVPSNNLSTYQWLNEANSIIGNSASITVTNPEKYKVIVTTDGCSKEKTIVVNNPNCIIEIPKGISPNGDGANDTFDLSNFEISKLEIYNRYGTEVYAATNYKKEWDGKSKNGNYLPSATYFYFIQFSDGNSKTGWVYLNR